MGRAEDLYDRIVRGGEKAIDEMIAAQQSEELFLDFKRAAHNGRSASLDISDRNNLAKAISGFGNSEGGIIMWGVDCRRDEEGRDVARQKVPLADAAKFKSWLEGAVSGCTIPPHAGVVHHSVAENRKVSGYVITLVPKGEGAPYEVVGVDKAKYYMRAGSNFAPVPHDILAGMFGRRPHPDIVGAWVVPPLTVEGDTVKCEATLIIENKGRGVAHDVFIRVSAFGKGGSKCKTQFQGLDPTHWLGDLALGLFFQLISVTDYRMPPGWKATPVRMLVTLQPPFEEAFELERIDGCDGALPRRIDLRTELVKLEQVYDRVIEKHTNGTLTEEERHRAVCEFLGIPHDEAES